ncbi:MAG: hypothetical protein IK095_03360 [Oscillospiraceae bacterium]|nr:hypothetical protein [Oscillospiraceae bacterium]
MTKIKAAIVTALLALCIALILTGLYLLEFKTIFLAFAGVFALTGFIGGTRRVYAWLSADASLPPVPICVSDAPDDRERATYAYEQIRDELRKEG